MKKAYCSFGAPRAPQGRALRPAPEIGLNCLGINPHCWSLVYDSAPNERSLAFKRPADRFEE